MLHQFCICSLHGHCQVQARLCISALHVACFSISCFLISSLQPKLVESNALESRRLFMKLGRLLKRKLWSSRFHNSATAELCCARWKVWCFCEDFYYQYGWGGWGDLRSVCYVVWVGNCAMRQCYVHVTTDHIPKFTAVWLVNSDYVKTYPRSTSHRAMSPKQPLWLNLRQISVWFFPPI